MFNIYLYVQFLLVTNLFNMKMYLFSEINFYSITDSITFVTFSLLCFYLLKLLGKILQHLDELYKWLHYNSLPSKMFPLVQYWHDCYGITNCFLIGFESCYTGGYCISFQGTPCSTVWLVSREKRSEPSWGWKCR